MCVNIIFLFQLCRKPFSTNIIGPLVAAGFRVVAMDCRGHGLSDKFYNSDDYGIKMVQGMKLQCSSFNRLSEFGN